MKTHYALIARGRSTKTQHGSQFSGLNDFMKTEAEDKVQAFYNIYTKIRQETLDITAVKVDGEKHLLGFTDEEWERVAELDVTIKEGTPDNGIQIQAIRDTPFH